MAFSRAVINFVVNTQAARQQILNFKNNINTAAKNISNSFVGRFGSLAGLGGGLKALTDAYNHIKKIADISDTFELPADEISKFSNTMTLFGMSTEESLGAIENLQQAIVDLRTTGSGALKNALAHAGIDLYKNGGKDVKNAMEIIEDLRRASQSGRLNESGQIAVLKELGLNSPAMLRMLRATEKEYAEMKKQGSSMNVVNQQTVDNVKRLNRAIEKLKLTWINIGAVILENVLPYIEKAVDWFNEFNNLSDDTKDIIIKVVGGFMALKPAIGIITTLKDVITLLASPLKAVLALIVANPILATIAAIALGIIYLDEIQAKWDEFINSGTRFSKFCKLVADQLKLVLKPFEWLGEGIQKITSWLNQPAEGNNTQNLSREEINALRAKAGLAPLPTDSELQASRAGMAVASNTSLTSALQSGAITSNTENSGNTVYQTFNFNGTGDELQEQVSRIVRQNATGVTR